MYRVNFFSVITISATCIWFNKKKKSGRDKYVAKHNAGVNDLIIFATPVYKIAFKFSGMSI